MSGSRAQASLTAAAGGCPRRKSKTRYSDKPSVAQFREFAEKLYVKRRVHERMNELIGGLVLDAELAAEGARDVDNEERRGWDSVH